MKPTDVAAPNSETSKRVLEQGVSIQVQKACLENRNNILMVMNQEYGAYNPSFALARRLSQEGFRVLYYPCDKQFEQHINLQGFECLSVPEEFHRISTLECWESFLLKSHEEAAEWLTPLVNTLHAHRVQAIFIDPIISCAAAFFIRSNIPLISLASNFEHHWNLRIPSSSTPLKPTDTIYSFGVVGFSWLGLWWKHVVLNRNHRSRVNNVVKGLARKYGMKYRVNLYGLYLQLPVKMFLMPAELEFPQARTGHYLGICVDQERRESDLCLKKLDLDKPMILCSLGTYSAWYPWSRQFFLTVIETFREQPQWNLVIHTGRDSEFIDLAELPSNIIMAETIPQLSLLKNTSVMITHGGAGGIKESIAHGVSMVLFPCKWDQPGNVTRAVHHGLGVEGKFDCLTTDKLTSLIRKVLDDPTYRHKTRSVRESVLSSRALDAGVNQIMAIISNNNNYAQQ